MIFLALLLLDSSTSKIVWRRKTSAALYIECAAVLRNAAVEVLIAVYARFVVQKLAWFQYGPAIVKMSNRTLHAFI